MARVSLNRSYIALISDLESTIEFGTSDRSDDDLLAGEVREMAAGRLRSVSRVTSRNVLGITLVRITSDQKERLRSWRGKTVLFRDVHGRRIYGVFYDFGVTDYRDRGGFDVSITLQKTTYSEAI